MVHPEESDNVNSVREAMAGTWFVARQFPFRLKMIQGFLGTNSSSPPSAPRMYDLDQEQCPVCLTNVQFGIETNCGHLFCGNSRFETTVAEFIKSTN